MSVLLFNRFLCLCLSVRKLDTCLTLCTIAVRAVIEAAPVLFRKSVALSRDLGMCEGRIKREGWGGGGGVDCDMAVSVTCEAV